LTRDVLNVEVIFGTGTEVDFCNDLQRGGQKC